MQGAEIEDEGSVLECMTQSEIEEQRFSMLIMTQRPLSFLCASTLLFPGTFKTTPQIARTN